VFGRRLGGQRFEVARVDLRKPNNVNYDPSQPVTVEVAGGGVFDAPKPDPHRVPPLSVDIQAITKVTIPGGSVRSTSLRIVLKNIGTGDLTLPIGVDSQNLLATGSGRTYLTLAVKGPDPTARDLASAKLAMNVEHPESMAKLQPGDTVVLEVSLGEKPQGADSVPLAAVVSPHQITGPTARDEEVGTAVRSSSSRYWK
jgi:hypothetical protein